MQLTAYYFMGQDLCMVPRHVRDDMAWMADAGTDSVAIGVHEFQLHSTKQQQLDILFDEAQRAGLTVHAIPSRWAGLVAGWPSAAGMFAATHPESWMRKEDGSPAFAGFCGGGICSIYDPATEEFFHTSIETMLDRWPLKGIIWDEIKVMHARDHSEHAIRALGKPSEGAVQMEKTIEFFSRANRVARQKRRDLTISCFTYAFLGDDVFAACAKMAGLDCFGIDGKCFPDEPKGKTLFGNMERVAAACEPHGVKTLALIETQSLGAEALQKTVQYLPAFLKQPVDHLLYYYYGACREGAEACMEGMKPLLRAWRRGGQQ